MLNTGEKSRNDETTEDYSSQIKLNFQGMKALFEELPSLQMESIYSIVTGKAVPNEICTEELISFLYFLCKKLNWLENENDQGKMKLNFKGMQTLFAELPNHQMEVMYSVVSSKEKQDKIIESDLIDIIAFLCRKLNWTEEIEAKVENLVGLDNKNHQNNLFLKTEDASTSNYIDTLAVILYSHPC